MQTLQHVVRAWGSKLANVTSIEREANEVGSWTVRTLASQPLQRLVERLKICADVRTARLGKSFLYRGGQDVALGSRDIQTTHWDLDCSFSVSRNCRSVGFSIGHSQDFSKATSLIFTPRSETLTIHRPSFPGPNSSQLINSASENAPHTLFTSRDPGTGIEQTETLDIRLWRDNSVLEVFVNGRTAITTRIYGGEETFGLRFFADDGRDSEFGVNAVKGGEIEATELVSAMLWDDIRSE